MLRTKLFVPPLRPNLVIRPHLLTQLNQGFQLGHKLTLISAPAGAGKTTLLSQFVAGTQLPTSWLSLDPADDEPNRFWTYFIAACQAVLDGVGESGLTLLSAARPLPADTIPTILINDFVSRDQALVLILDDYHVIQNQSIHKSLSFLLDHLPDTFHLVISTRTDPPWSLARYRARYQLIEIRAQDLRFSYEEAAEFLDQSTGLHLPADAVASLEERTEGWVAGLQLAAIAMQSPHSPLGQDDVVAFVQAFSGSNLYVAEYLLEEVLKRQPEQVQSFLLQTSILDRLNAELCDAVTCRQDSQATLTALYRTNAFVTPLDDQGLWFRYHHLFADLLQARLRQVYPADVIVTLHGRASEWYELNGLTLEAVNHGLAANDFERVAELVKRAARATIFAGQVNTLRQWLEILPDASFRAHPQLAFYLFWIDILQSKADLSEEAIQEQEVLLKSLPSSPENDRLRGDLAAVICRAMALSGRTARGIRLAQEALAKLPADDLASRARANSALAIAHDLEGRAAEAKPAYQACFSQALAAHDYRLAAHTTMARGLVQSHYGRLREAGETFQTIIDMGDGMLSAPVRKAEADSLERGKDSNVFFPAGQGYIGLGSIYLERNDLEAAEDHLQYGLELCRRGGLDGAFIGRMQLSRLRQAQGDLAGALEEIRLSKQASQRVDESNIATRQIQIALARRDVDGAWRWAAPFVEMLGSKPATRQPPLLFWEILEAIVARVYLAQEDIQQAFQLLDRLQATAGPSKRNGRLIEAHLLRALAYQKQNRGRLTPEAIGSFEHALQLGQPEGYVLLFLEEGPEVVPLLKAVAGRSAAATRLREYARRLLKAFAERDEQAAGWIAGQVAGLAEQLTPREQEVLELLAVGDSNQDIADKLVISVRTVKKHTSNIYGKLNVSNRTQAVVYARQVGLLPTDQ